MQEELDDTVKEHIVNLRVEGLTDLQTQLQENFEKYVKDLAVNLDDAIELVKDSVNNLSSQLENVDNSFNAYIKSFHPDAYAGQLGMEEIDQVADAINIQTGWTKGKNLEYNELRRPGGITSYVPHYDDNLSKEEYAYQNNIQNQAQKIREDVGDIRDIFRKGFVLREAPVEEILEDGYAKGTKNAKPGLHRINENGSEAIVTRRGVMLMPLKAGDGVIPADLTANLMEMAKSGMVPVQTPNFQVPEYNVSHNTNQSINIHYDNLIKIDGNADQSIIPQLEEIAKGLMSNASFKKNIYNYTTKEMSKDMRKAGH